MTDDAAHEPLVDDTLVDDVVIVDASDREIGRAGKLEAHVAGLLHRAVSVFIGDGAGRLLLQRRAAGKYHSGDLWTNSACGHPRPGESAVRAARRRLREEMGVRCALAPAGRFRYRAELTNGLVEHEIDHVFVGRWDGDPTPDPAEVAAWRWAILADVAREAREHPARFTAWFSEALARAARHPLLAGGEPTVRPFR